MEYNWPDCKLKWIDGSKREWSCMHVSKCSVLVDTAEGMYTYNTDMPEPDLPYRYVFLDELFEFSEGHVKTRGPWEYCECSKRK